MVFPLIAVAITFALEEAAEREERVGDELLIGGGLAECLLEQRMPGLLQLGAVTPDRSPGVGGHVGVVGEVERDLDVGEVRRAAVVLGEYLEHGVQPLLEGVALDLCSGDGVLEIVPPPLDDGEQQLFPRAELVLDRAPGDPGTPGDLVRAGLVVALLGDALDHRVEHARAGLLAVGPASPDAVVGTARACAGVTGGSCRHAGSVP